MKLHTLFLSTGLSLVSVVAQARAPQSAAGFVHALYTQLIASDFSERTERGAFSSSFLRLMDEDQRLAKGELGWLDSDPLSGTQDDEGAYVKSMQVRPLQTKLGRKYNQATADVTLGFHGSDGSTSSLHLTLVQLPTKHHSHKWLVYDVAEPGVPSMRTAIYQSNQAALKAATP